jgi:hypothetical protein
MEGHDFYVLLFSKRLHFIATSRPEGKYRNALRNGGKFVFFLV